MDEIEASPAAAAGAAGAAGAEAAQVKRTRRRAFIAALLVFLADQAVKWAVTYPLNLQGQYGRTITLTSFFDLHWTENRGVSLGLLSAGSEMGRWGLVALAAAIAALVSAWMWRERKGGDAAALALVLGGAFGNILDRVRVGYVVDYADLHFGDWHPFLVFNVADAAITIGVLLLLVRALLMRDGKANR
jgi:signal peptidase II